MPFVVNNLFLLKLILRREASGVQTYLTDGGIYQKKEIENEFNLNL